MSDCCLRWCCVMNGGQQSAPAVPCAKDPPCGVRDRRTCCANLDTSTRCRSDASHGRPLLQRTDWSTRCVLARTGADTRARDARTARAHLVGLDDVARDLGAETQPALPSVIRHDVFGCVDQLHFARAVVGHHVAHGVVHQLDLTFEPPVRACGKRVVRDDIFLRWAGARQARRVCAAAVRGSRARTEMSPGRS